MFTIPINKTVVSRNAPTDDELQKNLFHIFSKCLTRIPQCHLDQLGKSATFCCLSASKLMETLRKLGFETSMNIHVKYFASVLTKWCKFTHGDILKNKDGRWPFLVSLPTYELEEGEITEIEDGEITEGARLTPQRLSKPTLSTRKLLPRRLSWDPCCVLNDNASERGNTQSDIALPAPQASSPSQTLAVSPSTRLTFEVHPQKKILLPAGSFHAPEGYPDEIILPNRTPLRLFPERDSEVSVGLVSQQDMHQWNRWYSALTTDVAWGKETLYMFGEKFGAPRSVAWYGDAGCYYTYNMHTITAMPLDSCPVLLEIKQYAVQHWPQFKFNSILCNLYKDGGDRIGYHSDDERALGNEPEILSLSFQPCNCRHRKFVLRNKDTKQRWIIRLQHGCWIFMGGRCQAQFDHCVPAARRCKHPRVNLTLRLIKNLYGSLYKPPAWVDHQKKVPHCAVIGALEEYEEGHIFDNLKMCEDLNMHRVKARGIVGSRYYGAESVCIGPAKKKKNSNDTFKSVLKLNHNLDHGDHLLIHGAGQSPQNYKFGNGALLASYVLKQPVRLLRRSGSSRFAPPRGVRYCGLFYVVSWCFQNDVYWFELSLDASAPSEFIMISSGQRKLTQLAMFEMNGFLANNTCLLNH